jgi:hypothetical protein
LTSDGKPYGVERFKEIVKERYVISKNSNISYEDTGNMSPIERNYIIQFIQEDLQRQVDIINNQLQGRK